MMKRNTDELENLLLSDIFYQSFILFRKQAYTENERPTIV